MRGLDGLLEGVRAGQSRVLVLRGDAGVGKSALLATSLWAPIHVTRAALPVMRAQGAGHIVQVTMADGRRARPSLGAYRTATWGLAGYSEALAAAVAPLGIRVTIVEPSRLEIDWPATAARTLLRVVAEERLPLRLPLGADPVGLAAVGACSIRCEQYAR